jgi:hypothetical protein
MFNFVGIKQIRDLKVAKEEQDIGFYAGFVGEQCFFFHDWGFKDWFCRDVLYTLFT